MIHFSIDIELFHVMLLAGLGLFMYWLYSMIKQDNHFYKRMQEEDDLE